MMEEVSCINFVHFLEGCQKKDQMCLEHEVGEQLHFDNKTEKEMSLLNCTSPDLPKQEAQLHYNPLETPIFLDIQSCTFHVLNPCPMNVTLHYILQSLGFRYSYKIIYLGI